jgi:hypothetical protein
MRLFYHTTTLNGLFGYRSVIRDTSSLKTLLDWDCTALLTTATYNAALHTEYGTRKTASVDSIAQDISQ